MNEKGSENEMSGERITAERLDEIKARADAATAGPWFVKLVGHGMKRMTPVAIVCSDTDSIDWRDADYAFCAHAREDVPAMLAEIERAWGEIEARTAEREEARDWVRRLTAAERVLTCAFCGEAYPPGTPDHNADALTAHVRVCAKHPMREVEKERDVAVRRLTAQVEILTARSAAAEARLITTTDAAPDMPSLLDPERGVRWIVFIYREGGQLPTTAGLFSEREDAAKFYGTAGAQWSDSYLCEVKAGPHDGRPETAEQTSMAAVEGAYLATALTEAIGEGLTAAQRAACGCCACLAPLIDAVTPPPEMATTTGETDGEDEAPDSEDPETMLTPDEMRLACHVGRRFWLISNALAFLRWVCGMVSEHDKPGAACPDCREDCMGWIVDGARCGAVSQ